MQRRFKDQLQDSIANKGMAWLHVTPQASSTTRHNIEIFQVILSNLMFSVWCSAKLFEITRSHFTQLYTICVYTEPFDIKLSHFTQRYTVCTLYHSTLRLAISHNATPYVSTLYHSTLRCAIWRNATPFVPTLCSRHYPEPFDATLHRLRTVLQMSAGLFAIELVHFTISCSNSTWAARPFIVWLNYPCLGCSVSRRKT